MFFLYACLIAISVSIEALWVFCLEHWLCSFWWDIRSLGDAARRCMMGMSLHPCPYCTWTVRASGPWLSVCKMREVLTAIPRMSMSRSEWVANLLCLFVSISPVFGAESPHISHMEEIIGPFLQVSAGFLS